MFTLAPRGSLFWNEWIGGTLSAKDSIKGYLDTRAATSVTVCGHSLGGALATLLTLDVGLNTSCHAPTAYTYASPRVGDHIFAGSYNAAIAASHRISNRQDLVPKLPPILPLPYEHVNTRYPLNPPPNAINPTIPRMHHLTTADEPTYREQRVSAGRGLRVCSPCPCLRCRSVLPRASSSSHEGPKRPSSAKNHAMGWSAPATSRKCGLRRTPKISSLHQF
jgi:hypothetical protein